MPDISRESVCYIILKAREFDVQEGAVEEDYGGNPIDEGFQEILAARADDPTYAELKSFIDALDVDAQCELVALVWTGRGDFGAQEWDEALKLARERHSNHTAAYLLSMPLLGDFLEEGLAAFDISCTDEEAGHLA